MKAIVYQGPLFQDLKIIEVQNAKLQFENHLLIQVKSFALNRADIMQRKGLYPPPDGESEILGLECAGVVCEVGSSVTKFKVGDRVMALLGGGGYAEFVSVDEGLVLLLPKNYSFEEGASIPEAFLTAYLNLFMKANVQKVDNVLIHAGASGVGVAAIQILKNHSKNIFVTVSSREKADFCEKLGAIAIIYKQENFKQAIQAKVKEGIQVILDPVGPDYLKDNIELLSLEGTLILISLMSGREANIDLSPILRKRLKIMGSTLRNLPNLIKSKIVDSFRKDFFTCLENKQIVPVIDSVFKASQIIEAHKKMEANQNIGKIILSWQ